LTETVRNSCNLSRPAAQEGARSTCLEDPRKAFRMSGITVCPRCRSPLPANAPLGLCPACLVEAGLRGHSRDSLDVTAVGTAAAADELPDPALQPTCIGVEGSGDSQTSAGLPETGQMCGRYRIVRRLGRGGMGTVFEANETETGRRVALKLLTRALDPAAKLR